MCVNGELTWVELTIMATASVVILVLSVRYGRIAWRSSPDDFIAYIQSLRPSTWRTYGWLWGHIDAAPAATLWEARFLSVVAATVLVFVLVVLVAIAFHDPLGIAACEPLR